jgi:hypothetical protein
MNVTCSKQISAPERNAGLVPLRVVAEPDNQSLDFIWVFVLGFVVSLRALRTITQPHAEFSELVARRHILFEPMCKVGTDGRVAQGVERRTATRVPGQQYVQGVSLSRQIRGPWL